MSDTETKPTIKLPQANVLHRIVHISRFLRDEAKSVDAIAATSEGLGPRNVHYYLQAVETLGFAQQEKNGDWSLLPKGKELAEAATGEEVRILTRALYETEFCGDVIDHIKRFPQPGATHEDVQEVLGEKHKMASTTLGRRASTILGWMLQLGLVARSDGYFTTNSELLDDAGVVLRPPRPPLEPRPRQPRKAKPDAPFFKIVEIDKQADDGLDVYIEYSPQRAVDADILYHPLSDEERLIDGHMCRRASGFNRIEAEAFVSQLGGKIPEKSLGSAGRSLAALPEVPSTSLKQEWGFEFQPGYKEEKRREPYYVEGRMVYPEERELAIKKAFYDIMSSEHGEDFVGVERPTSIGRRLDAAVKRPDGNYWLYELKSATSSLDCFQEASGQLLVYAFAGKFARPERMVVVGEAALDDATKGLLDNLMVETGLTICYQRIDVENKTLGDLYPAPKNLDRVQAPVEPGLALSGRFGQTEKTTKQLSGGVETNRSGNG